jgi:hypothetical protein
LPSSNRQAVNRLEAILEDQLKNIPPEATTATLNRALAETRLRAGHEYTYNRIFGSQIVGLQSLNNRGGKATVAEAKQFFQPIEQRYPEVYKTYGTRADT